MRAFWLSTAVLYCKSRSKLLHEPQQDQGHLLYKVFNISQVDRSRHLPANK